VRPDDLRVRKTAQARLDCDEERMLMPSELAAFVTHAERTNVGTTSHPKFIPQLSAVRTNATHKKNEACPRFWYMLPPLARRHMPELFIARVNNLHPKTFLNTDHAVIDANFSTIWTRNDATIDAYALLACLNSFWVKAAMELTATVLGGGALKLEATHLRYLPIPALSKEQWTQMSILGEQLSTGVDAEATLLEVDRTLGQIMFGEENAVETIAAVKRLSSQSLENRMRK
jgi:hypothetical protein